MNLKEKWLEEIGEIRDNDEQDGGYVGGQDGSKQSPGDNCVRGRTFEGGKKPAEHHGHVHFILSPEGHTCVPDKVLGEILRTDVFKS